MGKHQSVRAALAAAALIALVGCSGIGTGTQPDVPGETSAPASTLASGASSVSTGQPSTGQQSTATSASTAQPGGPSSGQQSATSVTGTHQGAAQGSFARANSIPFPVAVGNTWVYRTTADGRAGRTTNRIVAAGPGPAGYQVTMSSTTVIAGTSATVQPVYVFYPDGSIGYPVPVISGVSVLGAGVRWPDAAGLASGRAYHSTLRVLVSQTGQTENANVTVQGMGTTSVTIPAGTYQASVVNMTIAAQIGTIQVTTWIAQGVGPVETAVLARVAGSAELSITNILLSYTKGAPGIGS